MDGQITLTLPTGKAELVLAALRVFGHLASNATKASGDPEDDPDTELTAEAFEVYLEVARQMLGGDGGWQSSAHSESIKALADQLEKDMLMIVHRNYRYTKEGLVKR